MLQFRISNMAVVSYTSRIYQGDIGKCLVFRPIWLFLQIGGPFCGRPYHEISAFFGVYMRAPDFC